MDVEGIFLNEISQRKKYHRSNVESKKNETNENRNTHKYRDQVDGCQRGGE